MQSMGMGMPFGGGLFGDFMGGNPGGPHQQQSSAPDPFGAMMPHGFMSPMMGSVMMMDPFQSMQQTMSFANNGNPNNGFSYCSSSVTSYTTDEHGRPQVYQQANEVKQGPGGLKETKASVRDSRTGRQELAIGHHLRDKAHIKKKSKNVYTGEEEQVEDLVNLDENEAETFEQDWMQQARNASSFNQIGYGGSCGPTRNNRLAITSGSRDEHQHYPSTSSRHASNLASKLFKRDKKKTKKTKEESRK